MYLAKYAFALKKVAKTMGYTMYFAKCAFALKKVAKTMGVFYVYVIKLHIYIVHRKQSYCICEWCILRQLSLKWCSLRHVALKKVATFMGVYKLHLPSLHYS